MQNTGVQPRGELSLRTVAMPADTNPAGDIFGGWIMSLMDLAAGIAAGTRAKGRVATAAVSNLSFLQPVKVGDVVCVYTEITKTGRTSITVAVEAFVLRRNLGERMRVTAAEFVLVAVDDPVGPAPARGCDPGRPRPGMVVTRRGGRGWWRAAGAAAEREMTGSPPDYK
jgi:acyl-CoA thioesterase YciA